MTAKAQSRDIPPARKKKPSVKKIKLGVAGTVLLLVLMLALGWKLYDLHSQIQNAETQQIALTEQRDQQQAENDKLQADIAGGGTPEQKQEIAREELGMVAPGDRVFYDVSN